MTGMEKAPNDEQYEVAILADLEKVGETLCQK